VARIDTSQITRNRKVIADSTIESPYGIVMEDADADFPERLYDQMPDDRVGLIQDGRRGRK
jgi:hypothetical protein